MGRHSADPVPGPTDPADGQSSGSPEETGAQSVVSPPDRRSQRNRIVLATSLSLVGVVLLVFGYISLTRTTDLPTTTSNNSATAAGGTSAGSSGPAGATTPSTAVPTSAPASPVVLPVTVLNNSPGLTAGLATRVAAALEAGGWPIASLENYDGTQLDQTTAFFTAGNAAEEAAAQALVTQFPEIRGGAQPRFDGLGGIGLTVAAVGDWLP